MAVLLLPSEKNDRNSAMSKKDKVKNTPQQEEVVGKTEKEVMTEQELADEHVKDSLADLQDEFQREKDRYLRLFAEFENYKKRTSREKVELFKTAGEDIMVAMLPVLDDFDRALKEIEKSEDDSLFKGVELISNKLAEALRVKGLQTMETKQGDVFDADTHEAITQIPAPEDSLKGKIIDVLEKGYTLGDKIIRYPKVVIGQ